MTGIQIICPDAGALPGLLIYIIPLSPPDVSKSFLGWFSG